MDKEREFDKDLSMLLWGKQGYKRPEDESSNDFSIEKVLRYLKEKKEAIHDHDL